MDVNETVITSAHLPKLLRDYDAENNIAYFSQSEELKGNNSQKQMETTLNFDEFMELWLEEIMTIWQQDTIVPLEEVLERVKTLEKMIGSAYIEKTLQHTIGNRKEAAQRLQITDRRLRYLLKEKGKQ